MNMAKKKSAFKAAELTYRKGNPKKTSIGRSKNSRPLNKHTKAGWKKYRGQGV